MTPQQSISELTEQAAKNILGCIGYIEIKNAFFSFADSALKPQKPQHAFYIVDPENEEYWFALRRGTRQGHLYKSKSRIPHTIYREALFLPGPLLAKKASDLPDAMRKCDAASISMPVMFIPLAHKQEPLGLIALSLSATNGKSIGPLAPQFGKIAQSVAIALRGSHHHEINRTRIADLSKIADATANLQLIKKVDALIMEILAVSTKQIGFDRAIMCLVDQERGMLKGCASRGYEGTCTLIDSPLKPPQDVFSKAIKKAQPVIISDVSKENGVPDFIRHIKQIAGAIVLPLTSQNKPLGALWGDFKNDHGQLTPSRVESLTVFANHVGTAIANARLYEDVERTAETDALTGVYNRRYFDKAAHRELSRVRRYNHPLSLMMLDVTGFKRFNDMYGHVMGDEILRRIAAILSNNVRDIDIVARYGGDEFVILMPNTTEKQAVSVHARIQDAIQRHNSQPDNDRYQLDLSTGLFTGRAETIERVIEEADRAMYKKRELNMRHHLLESLASSKREEIIKWDHFVASILKVLYEKEMFFFDHSRGCYEYAKELCAALGVDMEMKENICLAALLHDIGKISIDFNLLNKPSALTEEEYEIVKTHPILGDDLLKGSDYLAEVRTIIRTHHERYDGKTTGPFPGYPDGLKGAEIPFGSRILKIVDAYETMVTNRPYRRAIPPLKAAEELVREKGASFDPNLVDVFIKRLQQKELIPVVK